MRLLKLCTILGVLAALVVPAGAVGIPFSQAYNGPLVMHLTNWEDSVTYSYNKGFLKDGITQIALGTPYAASDVMRLSTGINLKGGENGWGIFQIDQILSGSITGGNSISTGAITLYDKGTSPIDIVGIFYGGTDVTVTFTNSFSYETSSAGLKFEIFTQPDTYYGSLSTPALGASARTDQNEFPNVGYDGTNTNTLLVGAERVITGTSQPGMDLYEFYSSFNALATSGTFNTYVSVAPLTEAFDSSSVSVGFSGSQNTNFNTNVFPTPTYKWDSVTLGPMVPGTTADFRLKGGSEGTDYNWLVRSSDPLTTAFVPEPITMLGLVLGVGGLAGYVRKRRA